LSTSDTQCINYQKTKKKHRHAIGIVFHCVRDVYSFKVVYVFSPFVDRYAMIRSIDMFSGIGGFALAMMDIAKPIAYCEINPTCRRILRENMARNRLHHAPIWDDVTQISRDMLEHVIDGQGGPIIVTAGFPCQDVSIINSKAKGIDGSKSKMFYEILRIIDILERLHLRDVYIVLENSPIILKRGLDTMVTELVETRGMVLKWVKCAAEETGAYHRRRRWFALVHPAAPCLDVLARLHNIQTKTSWCYDEQPCVLEKRTGPIPYQQLRSMGNAIVPAQLALALQMLSNVDDGENVQTVVGASSPYSIRTHRRGGIVSYARRACIKGPRIPLTLDDDRIRIECQQWPTPLASRVTAERLKRAFGPSLPTAVFYSSLGREITCTTDYRIANARWYVSLRFLAWLMGYPEDWVIMGGSISHSPSAIAHQSCNMYDV
jgi:site-specific DNA-cytosine methylase